MKVPRILQGRRPWSGEEAAGDEALPPAGRVRRPGSAAKKPSYMVLCRYHSRSYVDTKCTRTATWTSGNAEEQQLVIRKLKSWCVSGPDVPYNGSPPNRLPHQQHDRAGLRVLTDQALEALDLPALPDPQS